MATLSDPASEHNNTQAQTRWICNPTSDVLMALSWIPFSAAAFLARHIDGAAELLMVYVFLFSFTHQPLTLVLVYGDRFRFAQRPQLFRWSPLVFGLAIVLCMLYSPILLALAAGLWNAEHTLMQRYGITRIYGRKVGQQHSGVELYMLFSWLILALVWAAADPTTLDKVNALGIGGINLKSFALLTSLRPMAELALPAVMLAAGVLMFMWLREETRRQANRAKHLYLVSMLALFALMLIDPIAGFIGYVGSHAVEYFIIVNHNLSLQYQQPGHGGGTVGRLVRAPAGRVGFFLLYLLSIAALLAFLQLFTSRYILAFTFFVIGALHFFYDGFIWKLRKPAVARSLGAVSSP